ncbi:toxin C-terminal domain-containing protein [Streptomyces sp. NBC_00322]|uniref:polymorphic toxin-type HINT domain-containing protein n=1 Tax=Streptomyces sp. NBC_00322 TaxID=2975712 RepID=UPI002E2AE777|nr:toxin C-terminal domain-containing protein [Streptomyces sp. NBC_00322]
MPLSAQPLLRFRSASILSVGLLSGALSLSLLSAPAWANPGEGFSLRPLQKTASVPGKDLNVSRSTKLSPSERNRWHPPGKTAWPTAGQADVVLPGAPGSTAKEGAVRQRVQAGSLPVHIGRPTTASAVTRAGTRTASPDRVRVRLADRKATQRAGIQGLLFSIQPTSITTAPGAAAVQVDYASIESAFGAGWSSRLRLVQLPSCALTTPGKAACLKGVPLATNNNTKARTLTATVAFPASQGTATQSRAAAVNGSMAVLAAAAAADGGEGSFKATSLSPSGSWSAGGSSGGFGWSTPLGVPSVPGGLQPKVALSYNSSAVDGRTSSTNNQTSWIGEGWDYSQGFIERTYAGCENDKQGGNNTEKVGDLCWKSQNATLSLNGTSTALVWDAGKSVWKLAEDDGSRVERILGSSPNDINGDEDYEYWKVTSLDGTQYWFGKNRLPGWTSGKEETNSVFTVPVYGNHSGEPGHGSDFASSAATQGWRWNLDYVVDPHHNAMALYYSKETGYYAQNLKVDDPVSYIRGGYLSRIDYGLRAGAVPATVNPAGRVTFGVAERCLANCGTFDESHAASWPDVPVDLDCTAGKQCLKASPSFWSRKRLTDINTFALQGSTMQPVDTWTLAQSFPATGDVSKPALWLESIQHTGKAGTLADLTLPKTTFGGTPMPNRVDSAEGRPPLNKYRITRVTSETGGETLVNYSPTDCTSSTLPSSPDQNTKRCYPSWWTPDGAVDPVKDWFHKYLVTQVIEDDTTAGTGSESKTTTYEYANGPNWRRDTSEFNVDKHRSWSVFRGYGTVRTLTGATNRTKTETSYFLGMSGDTLADGSPRPVAKINGITDRDDFAGRPAQTRTYDKDGTGGKVVAKTTYTPWESDPTATQNITGITDPDKPGTPGPVLPDAVARHAGTVTEAAATLLDDGTTWRSLTTTRDYDPVYGLLTAEGDDGDIARGVKPKCTRTSYVTPDTTNWLISYPSQVTTVAQAPCTLGYLNPAITGSSRTFYDEQAPGVAPNPGQANVTKTEQASKLDINNQLVWETTTETAYDQYGRIVSAAGQDGQPVTTAYTPAAGAQPTTVTVTNIKEHSTTTALDGLRGLTLKVTDPNQRAASGEYDALGRLTKVWSAGRATTANPNATFAYNISPTAPSTVTTKNLYENGTWGTSVAIYDSLLRERQTQMDAIGTTGRSVASTFYDTHGRAFQSDAPFYNDQAVSTALLTVTPNQIPQSNVTEYDGRGRPTAAVTLSLNVENWRTTFAYGDNWTSTVPPVGGTATLAIDDIRGRAIEGRQYKDRNPLIGAADSQYEKTTYAYDRAGNLEKVTDASTRNSWTYTYDLRGRQTATTDPDKGASSMGYGADGRLQTTTDARVATPDAHLATLATTYDTLGRKTSLRIGSVTGTKLAEWTYDTATGGKGLPASSTRYDNSVTPAAAYKTAVTGYDSAGRATGTTVTVPSVTGEEKLAGTYTIAATDTPVSGLPATAAYSTGNTNATTALPAETVTNHYGAQDQLGIVDGTLSQVYLRGASYTPFGELAQASLGNLGTRVIQTLGYDTVTRRLATSIVDRETTGPQTLSNIKYTYDTVGNLTRIRDDQNDGTIADDQCFAYDWSRRLSEAWSTADACTTKPVNGTGTPALGTVDPYWTSWTFTGSGDRATETQHKAGPVPADTTRSYAYPTTAGAAQPHAVRTVTATGGATGADTYQYDATGNLTKKTPATGAVQDVTWNEEGKLATSTISGATTKFLYDAEGTRILKREPTATTLYLPGGQELVLTKSTGALAGTRYYSVPGGSAIRTSSDGKVRLLVADHRGTNTLSVTATTLAVNRRKTMPYGAPRGTAPFSWPSKKGFVGGDIDTITGFTHIGARDYDPATGRFISVDPVMDLTNPQQMQGYSYANNTPVTSSDPSGLFCDGCSAGNPDTAWTPDNGPGCTHYSCYDHDGNVDTSTPVKGGGSSAPPGAPPSQGKPTIGGVPIPTPKELAARGHLTPWNTYQDALHTWAVGTCQGSNADEARAFCRAATEVGLLDAKQPWVGVAITVIGGCALAAEACVGAAVDAVAGEIEVAAGGSLGSGATLATFRSKLSGLYSRLEAESDRAAPGDTAALRRLLSGCKCFLAGTDVLMADGSTKDIEDIEVGDEVLATDPETGKSGSRKVSRLIRTEDDKYFNELTIATDDGPQKLIATHEHPFWSPSEKRWVEAGQLQPSATLLTDDGTTVTVTNNRAFTKHARTYNLTVEDLHTYYVLAGKTPVLVHNSNCNSLTRAQSDDVANFLGYTKTKVKSAGGAPIWENKKAGGGQPRYITYDRTGHNKQAVFKGASFRNPFQSTKDSARDGTYGLDVSPTGEVLGLKWLAK